jgi:hypothetical protein
MSEARRTGAMARVPIKREGKSNREREYGSIWRAFWELSRHMKRCCSGGIPSEKMCVVLISESVRYEQAHAAGRLRAFATTFWATVEHGRSNIQGSQKLPPQRCHHGARHQNLRFAWILGTAAVFSSKSTLVESDRNHANPDRCNQTLSSRVPIPCPLREQNLRNGLSPTQRGTALTNPLNSPASVPPRRKQVRHLQFDM